MSDGDHAPAEGGVAGSDVRGHVERTFRDESGRVLATLIRVLGDFDLAEEALSDAFVAALETWPRDGVPRNPGAWITTAARNRALDRIRRARLRALKLAELEGNLAALASAAKASELSLQMQKSMESLRASVNKVATLASETSLFLTQNVDRMVQEMKVYDEGTEQLVEANLKAEREVQEQRINETILLAEQGMKSRQGARAG